MDPLYDCLEVTDLNQSVRHDLTGVMLATPDEVFFTDGRSFAPKQNSDMQGYQW